MYEYIMKYINNLLRHSLYDTYVNIMTYYIE